jgi:hypothetical protein
MASFTVSKDMLVQLMALQQQQMNILQSILTGSTPAPVAKVASVAGSRASGKGSRGPRGSSGWDLFKKKVRAEMSEENPGVTYSLKEIADECATRKAAGEYDESYWKAQALALKLNASGSAAGGDSDAESETPSAKKAGRPKGSKNKTADAAPAAAVATPKKDVAKKTAPAAPKKTAPPPPPPPAKDEDEDEYEDCEEEEWKHKGVTYAKNLDNDVFELSTEGIIGKKIGRYNPLTNNIE